MPVIPRIEGITPTVMLLASLVLMAFVTLIRAWAPLKKLAQDENTLIREDYTRQIGVLREDLQANKAEIQGLSGRLAVAEAESRRRGDRINNLTFIVQLVMNELQRLDPDSIILNQASRLLIQLAQPLDANPAQTLHDLARIDEAAAKKEPKK